MGIKKNLAQSLNQGLWLLKNLIPGSLFIVMEPQPVTLDPEEFPSLRSEVRTVPLLVSSPLDAGPTRGSGGGAHELPGRSLP